MTTEATERDLVTEAQVTEIEAVNKKYRIDWRYPNHRKHVDALIRDWRAMKTSAQTMQADFDSYSQRVGSENAALREQLDSAQENFTRRTEQLAQAEKEVRGVLIMLGKDAIHSRPDGGAEDIYESLAISVTKLKSELARTRQHRDDLIVELNRERQIGNKVPARRLGIK